MPKRSNEFQKLVYLVKKQMAGSATVTESKLLVDRLTGTEREVDVCIEGPMGGHDLVIGIECRDHTRRADVTWVESMKAKHERLPTNALVLASRSGFTGEALRIAKLSGIETLSLQGMDEDTVDRVFGECGSLWAKEFTLSPTKVVLRVTAVGDLPAENVTVFPDNLIHSTEGAVIGTVREYLDTVLRLPVVGEQVGRQAADEYVAFVIEWESPKDKNGGSLCLTKLEPTLLRPIELVRVKGTFTCRTSEFRLRHGRLGTVSVAWSTGTLHGKDSILVASKTAAGEQLLTLHFKGTAQE